MIKYRNTPVEIEAMVFTYPPSEKLEEWMGNGMGFFYKAGHPEAKGELEVCTLEDGEHLGVRHIAVEGDYIVKGVQGEFYAVKPDIFHATYEAV